MFAVEGITIFIFSLFQKIKKIKFMINRLDKDSFNKAVNVRVDNRDCKWFKGFSTLTFAPEFVDKNTVKFLIEGLGMSVTKHRCDSRNCFLSAALGGKIETMKYLNSNFPELKYQRDNWNDTSLTSAAWVSNKETVQFLIEEMEINVTETGYEGRNCFLRAAEQCELETLKYLQGVKGTQGETEL